MGGGWWDSRYLDKQSEICFAIGSSECFDMIVYLINSLSGLGFFLIASKDLLHAILHPCLHYTYFDATVFADKHCST